jgi:hypothetical protein
VYESDEEFQKKVAAFVEKSSLAAAQEVIGADVLAKVPGAVDKLIAAAAAEGAELPAVLKGVGIPLVEKAFESDEEFQKKVLAFVEKEPLEKLAAPGEILRLANSLGAKEQVLAAAKLMSSTAIGGASGRSASATAKGSRGCRVKQS